MTLFHKKDFQAFLCEATASTMDLANSLVEENSYDGRQIFSVSTRYQYKGRGRQESHWIQKDQEGQTHKSEDLKSYNSLRDIYKNESTLYPVTFVFPEKRVKVPKSWLSSLVGCAIYDASIYVLKNILTLIPEIKSNTYPQIPLYLKWPNDFVFLSRSVFKICGILIEHKSRKNGDSHFNIGIGYNFFSTPKVQKAKSFLDSVFDFYCLKEKDKKNILKRLMTKDISSYLLESFTTILEKELYEYLCFERGSKQITSLVLERSLPIGTCLGFQKNTKKGEFFGLNEDGALLIKGYEKNPIYADSIEVLSSKKESTDSLKELVFKDKSSRSLSLLALDIGNTRLHLTYSSKINPPIDVNLNHNLFFDGGFDVLKEMMQPILTLINKEKTKEILISYTSVILSDKTKVILKTLHDFITWLFPEMNVFSYHFSEDMILSSTKIKGDFQTSHLGGDRALKYFFASKKVEQEKRNVLVFSFGTAFTCEALSKDKELLENFVAPGIQMAFQSMHNYTDLLPLLEANIRSFEAKDSTWDQDVYLQRGVFLTALSTLYVTLKRYAPSKAYITGGNAKDILSLLLKTFPNENFELEYVSFLETRTLIELSELMIDDILDTVSKYTGISYNSPKKKFM